MASARGTWTGPWALFTSAVIVAAAVASCSTSTAPGPAPAQKPTGSGAPAGGDVLSDYVRAIMSKPQYAKASWSMLAVDLTTGRTLESIQADRLAFTGSTRKLFSVGLALEQLGPDATTTTEVYRLGTVSGGVLRGDVSLVGAGDLTLGGRRVGDQLQFTDFDHNDANNLGTAVLTPQDPLTGLDALARQIRQAGITRIEGDVAVDDRLFTSFRVPNQQLLISPTILNEDMVDVTVTPTTPGQPARIDYRPKTPGFTVTGTVMTTAVGTEPTVEIPQGRTPAGTSVTGVVSCYGIPGCSGKVSGTIPVGYQAPLSGRPAFVGTFRIDTPAAYARTAFIAALQRSGVSVGAQAVAANPTAVLPAERTYPRTNRIAAYTSLPYAQEARLILKVSLNLGANLALTRYGLSQGETTVTGALAAERRGLEGLGIPGDAFDFPTNGSGSPDSKATPRAIVDMLTAMSRTPVADTYRNALPLLGVDGSLAGTGRDLPAKGHVHGKTGTTVEGGKLVAENIAGYVDARSGHRIAYAIILNDFGQISSLDDVIAALTDEAAIANELYEKY